MFDIGEFDRKCVLKTFTTSKNSWNHDVKTETDFATVWAKRVDKRPSEEFEASQIQSITRTEWTIRYISGVKRTMYLTHDGETFEIVGIHVLVRCEFLTLVTEFRETN